MSLRPAASRKTSNSVTVTAETARDHSVLGGVFEYFQGVVSSRQSQGEETRERILWARFEVTDLNDASLPHNGRSSMDQKCLPLILILGYTKGYSVWSIQGDGEAQELLSVHDGPSRFATILKTPYPGSEDEFADQRPIIAVVMKKGVSHPYTRASFKSLLDGSDVRHMKFDNDQRSLPIVNILSNRKVVLLVRSRAAILVLDAATLLPRFHIKNGYKSDRYPYNPVSLGTRWLAYADSKLSAKHQSIGGMSSGLPQTYKSTIIGAAKKVGIGISMLSDKVYEWTGASSDSKLSSSPKTARHAGQTVNAIVSILDLEELFRRDKTDEVSIDTLDRDEGVIANFPAHTGEDSKIAALAFDPSGMLLVTACTLGHSFHVFRLLPHPLLSSQTAVHHLYTLYRGDTDGTVQDISFSNDSRWISVSTLRGTSHVFPITPYGGNITTRTHTGDKVVNQLSRFETTAGVDETVKRSSLKTSSDPTPPASGLSTSPKFASSVVTMGLSVHSWGNPRSPPLPSSIQLEAMAQIKQPYIAPEGDNMGHLATDELPTLQATDTICIATVFAPTRTRTSPGKTPQSRAADSLFVLGANGILTEHMLTPQKQTGVPDGDDAPIELCHKAELEWDLLRQPHWAKLGASYSAENSIVTAYKDLILHRKATPKLSQSDSEWLANIEIETHPAPHRRLWMGPQFKFKTYQSPKITFDEIKTQVQGTAHNQQIQFNHSSTTTQELFGQSAELSVTPLTLQTLSQLDPPDTSQLELHSLVIPQGSMDDEKIKDPDVVQIFGSYKDSKPDPGDQYVTSELQDALNSAIEDV